MPPVYCCVVPQQPLFFKAKDLPDKLRLVALKTIARTTEVVQKMRKPQHCIPIKTAFTGFNAAVRLT